MADRNQKSSRPFYELPANIKPCSKIIKETRMQLNYQKQLGNEMVAPALNNLPSDYFGSCDFPEVDKRLAGMRTVNTQRPFTPRESISLWGISARKRPPSAFSLSRLSIEEIDESRPSSSSWSSSIGASSVSNSIPVIKGKPRMLIPKGSLTMLPSQINPILLTEVDRTKLRMNSMSLDSISSSSRITPGINRINQPTSNLQNNLDDLGTIKSRLSYQMNDLDEKGDKPTHYDEESNKKIVSKNKKSTVLEMKFNRKEKGNQEVLVNDDPHQKINKLEVAVEYLRCFVIESKALDKPRPSDVVSILKKICTSLSEDAQIMQPEVKKQMLQLLFKIVERNQTDEEILFWASFVLLHCKVMGKNLATVFKMVFKSSRSKCCKDAMKETNYLNVFMESFAQICPKSQTESTIYGYGTLKFICTDGYILNRIIDLNLISIMALHLKILNCKVEEMDEIPESIYNGTFQLTSILRSVVGEEESLLQVIQSGLLEELCNTLVWIIDDIDVLTNTVRILSVVSMDETCCEIIMTNEYFCEAVVRILKLWYGKEDIMVRLTYCLGNLLANSDEMRVKLFEEPEAFENILRILSYYIGKTNPISMDISVKITRMLANWILNPSVGSEIGDDPNLSEVFYSTLQMKDISEELVLCVMCALNNTSFYKNYHELDEGTMKTVQYLYKNLDMKDIDARTEAVKILGNLSRNDDVRLMAAEYMKNILLSLEEESEELLCATCGVLINVIIEEKVKAEFLGSDGICNLIDLVKRSEDSGVCLMAVQIVWNLIISNENQHLEGIYKVPTQQMLRLKQILLDKILLFGSEKDENNKMFSPDFETLAQNLLKKL